MEITDEMIERGAVGLCLLLVERHGPTLNWKWYELPDELRNTLREDARAVLIAALGKPYS